MKDVAVAGQIIAVIAQYAVEEVGTILAVSGYSEHVLLKPPAVVEQELPILLR